MSRRTLAFAAAGAVALGALSLVVRAASRREPLPVVDRVDLARYAGRWYEIARLPMYFQRACASDTTATYTLRPDGRVTVVNSCFTAEGKEKRAEGVARVADRATNAKLEVSFFGPFWGDYWILDLDPGYRYALVGEPRRRYLWILARQPTLDEGTVAALLAKAASFGYELAPLVRTRHGVVAGDASGKEAR